MNFERCSSLILLPRIGQWRLFFHVSKLPCIVDVTPLTHIIQWSQLGVCFASSLTDCLPTITITRSYLTAFYNATPAVRTLNLAHGAATIDRYVIPPLFPLTTTFAEQAAAFATLYGYESTTMSTSLSNMKSIPWSAATSIAAIWVGVVDLALLVRQKASLDLVPRLIATYSKALATLYTAGVRNLLLIAAPPLDLAPDSEGPELAGDAISAFNAALGRMRDVFVGMHPGVNVWIMDADALFRAALREPHAWPQTATVNNTDGWCIAYHEPNTPKLDDWNQDECEWPVVGYWWRNPLHPTSPAHDLLAARIVEDCFGGVVRRGFCS